MTIFDAMKQAGLSYRLLGKKVGIPTTALHRLIAYGEYPKRVPEGEVKNRISRALASSEIDPAGLVFPRRGRRPGREPLSPTAITAVEEIDLMQLDRNVLALFGLRKNPFLNDIEDDTDVFRSPSYQTVETAIRDAIEQRGFLAIAGDSGSGKTTIWDGIEAECGQRDDTIICRPQVKSREDLSPEHLARCLIYGLLGDDVTIRANAEDRGRQLSTALRAVRSGEVDRKAVLLIDDAHFCGPSVLRQLKTFFEEKIGRFRLLTIILIGLPTLKTKLAEFPEIGNRIRLLEVPPFPVKEYLDFKLRRASSSLDKLFSSDGLQAFLERFQVARRGALGRPLVINASCIRAMVMLHQNGAQPGERITREIIDRLPESSSGRRSAA